MSKDDRRTDLKESADEQAKIAESKENLSELSTDQVRHQSGLTDQLGKPLVDRKEESTANTVESIQSQYQQLRKYKHLAVSGVTGAVGDLLGSGPKSEDTEGCSSLDDLLSGNTKSGSADSETKNDESAQDSKSD